MEAYSEIMARFYDVIYAGLRSGVDHQYYVKTMANTTGRVLEIGAGTGRLLVDANEAGADAWGIEPSTEMFRLLLNKQGGLLEGKVWEQEAAGLDLPGCP